MKTLFIRLLCLTLAWLPLNALAQANIMRAFDAIIKCPDARISELHTLNRDPATNAKLGQSDVYNFTLPANKKDLIKNVLQAFEKDRDRAYSLSSGTTTSSDVQITLAVGDDSGGGVRITERGNDYIYALFLAPKSEDPSGKYRYAYALRYREQDGKITGRLVVTYATTLMYRQQQAQQKQTDLMKGLSGEIITIAPTIEEEGQSWFETEMGYLQGIMSSRRDQTRIALAVKAYRQIQLLYEPDAPKVSVADKETVREVLKTMVSDRTYSDKVLNKLLNQCIATLK